MTTDLDAVLSAHDALLARRSVDVWIGAIPAFALTDSPHVVGRQLGPFATARELWRDARDEWSAATTAGLHAARAGFVLGLGGETAASSPFIRYLHVVPALLRYLNNHPALSYWFAGEHVGALSRGARPDEGSRELFDELGVALGWLEQLADHGELGPEATQRALGPLLGDRAELRITRLTDGVIELPAIRMPENPGMLAALAALFRSIVARLVVAHYRAPLVDWHDELHDRFALPTALQHDLRLVLGDLDEHGLGMPAQLRHELEAWRPDALTCRLGDARLELRRALEFWPLVDERAATQRWELAIHGYGPDRVLVAGRWAQLHDLGDGTRAIGIRRRVAEAGLHAGMPVVDPLVIEWECDGRAQKILLRADGTFETEARATGVTATSYWPEIFPFTIDLRRAILPPWTS
jgi:uncharacterized protein (DUF2126 family)